MSKKRAVIVQATLATVCTAAGLGNLWLFDLYGNTSSLIISLFAMGAAVYAAIVGGKISACEYWDEDR